ncbi:MAG: IS30 family transposase [Bacteroidales bacterium]|nr:IS30 family transposase [Bacteroidales bacterium]
MKHLTREQRYTICKLKNKDHTNKYIADILGVDKSTVGRELKRNSDKRSGKYSFDLADRKAKQRQKTKKKKEIFLPCYKEIIKYFLIENQYSPEQISGLHKRYSLDFVSHETIYKWIWEEKKKGSEDKLHLHLRRQGRRNRKRGNNYDNRGLIKNRVDISERPIEVERRERFGDLEIDLIIGENHKGALLTINERKTGIVKIRKLEGKEAKPLAQETINVLSPFKDLIHTITADNGKEFAYHEEIARKLNILFYFARPYHSWERGSNENLNGLIRQYFKKGMDFSKLTDKMIQEVEDKLNNRPRKRFGYLSPLEQLNKVLTNEEKVAFKT